MATNDQILQAVLNVHTDVGDIKGDVGELKAEMKHKVSKDEITGIVNTAIDERCGKCKKPGVIDAVKSIDKRAATAAGTIIGSIAVGCYTAFKGYIPW